MNKWKTKFSYWKFDKKILLLVTVSILIVTPVSYTHLSFNIYKISLHGVHEDIYTSAFCLILRECVGETWI